MNEVTMFALFLVVVLIAFFVGQYKRSDHSSGAVKELAYEAFDDCLAIYDATKEGKEALISRAVAITRQKILDSELDEVDKTFWDEVKILKMVKFVASVFFESFPP
jgi:hypothetical protein